MSRCWSTPGVGDYRAGDEIWCQTLRPEDFGRALNRDVLVPRPAGRFLFGRLINRDGEKLQILPLEGRRAAASRRQPAMDRDGGQVDAGVVRRAGECLLWVESGHDRSRLIPAAIHGQVRREGAL